MIRRWWERARFWWVTRDHGRAAERARENVRWLDLTVGPAWRRDPEKFRRWSSPVPAWATRPRDATWPASATDQ